MLQARSAPGDRSRAEQLLASSLRTADELGMAATAERVRVLMA